MSILNPFKPIKAEAPKAWDRGKYVTLGRRYPIDNLHPHTYSYTNYDMLCRISDKMIWRIGTLEEDTGTVVTLLCNEIVKCGDWELSSLGEWSKASLRDWLCSATGFMSYFTTEEKSRMIDYEPSWNWENPPRDGDKAFILSGGGEWGVSKSGEYGYEQQIDAFIRSYNAVSGDTCDDRICQYTFYWTRTKREPAIVWAVRDCGDFCDNNLSDGSVHFGLRPAIKINTLDFTIRSGDGTLERPYIIT